MGNMKITVSEDDFKRKAPEERDWMLFEGIIHVNTYGCNYARKTYRRLYGIAAATGLIGGFMAVIGRIFAKWLEFF